MDELEASLTTYEAQFSQIEQALAADGDNADLKQLSADLQQLIALTKQNLLEEKKKALLAECDQMEKDSGVEPSRIEPPPAPSDVSQEIDVEDETAASVDLSQLEGKKCKAPHRGRGSTSSSSFMHNAMIFQAEMSESHQGDVVVRVVFSHPTCTAMVACPFYLEGRCRFEDGQCKYSHGEVARLSELADFEEPDYTDLKEGSAVLAKAETEKLWTHATVEGVEGDSVHLKFASDHRDVKTVKRENVFPLRCDDGDEDDEDDSNLVTGLDEDESLFVPVDLLARLNPDSLGDWEEHTRGIGSRLMQKMGYVAGTGLGRNAEGRVQPVTATIYPQGKSLDWCMELREKAGGGDVLSVEKTLRRQQAKEEKKAKARHIREKEREEKSIFGFLNRKLGGGGSGAAKRSSASEQSDGERDTVLRKNRPGSGRDAAGGDSKRLNVCSLQISEEIRRTERDIGKLKQTLARYSSREPALASGVRQKIVEKEARLQQLRGREGALDKRRKQSESTKKLTIF